MLDAKNFQFWPQNSVFKDAKNNGVEVDLAGGGGARGGGANRDAHLCYAIAYIFDNRHILFPCSHDFLRQKTLLLVLNFDNRFFFVYIILLLVWVLRTD